jgi:hypothetical protein
MPGFAKFLFSFIGCNQCIHSAKNQPFAKCIHLETTFFLFIYFLYFLCIFLFNEPKIISQVHIFIPNNVAKWNFTFFCKNIL